MPKGIQKFSVEKEIVKKKEKGTEKEVFLFVRRKCSYSYNNSIKFILNVHILIIA